MIVNREDIIQALKEGLENIPEVFAIWLEGSDGTQEIDEYSDLDIVIDVQDGFEEKVLENLETILFKISPLDLSYESHHPHPQLRYKVYHLEETPESLFLDVTIQSHSRDFSFTIEDKAEIPKVIFDKTDVIQYKNVNIENLRKN